MGLSLQTGAGRLSLLHVVVRGVGVELEVRLRAADAPTRLGRPACGAVGRPAAEVLGDD